MTVFRSAQPTARRIRMVIRRRHGGKAQAGVVFQMAQHAWSRVNECFEQAVVSAAHGQRFAVSQRILARVFAANLGHQMVVRYPHTSARYRAGAANTSRLFDHSHRGALVVRQDCSSQARSEEHTSELQSLMRISYAVFCLKKKKKIRQYVKDQLCYR